MTSFHGRKSTLRIVVGTYMIRYPLGGMVSWSLQWLVGLMRLGHEVFIAETGDYPNACYDPDSRSCSDDPCPGLARVLPLLISHGMEDRWVYVDYGQKTFGMSRARIKELFRSADLFIDLGTHGAWQRAGYAAKRNVIVDGEPGYTQLKQALALDGIGLASGYDVWFSNGYLVGAPGSRVPVNGIQWKHVFNPVVMDLFPSVERPRSGVFRTVMNWRSHASIEFEGRVYGQKDIEFARFMGLAGRVSVPLEISVAGSGVPVDMLTDAGWRIGNAETASATVDAYRCYIGESLGEWSVCKHVFVAMRTGWFSDRSAAFLASGRPVVLQDTGFSACLPCGEGLIAFDTVDDAAGAIQAVMGNWENHSRRAREIAFEFLSDTAVLPQFLSQAFGSA